MTRNSSNGKPPYAIHRIMRKAYEDMTREELIRELRLMSLRRQVTPHFLFNSLSVAIGLVTQSPRMAIKFLRHMAVMYRYLLSYGNTYYVPIEQELEMMQQYYVLMSIRHVDSIHLNISPEVLELKGCPVPPLAMQGLLENAIKHNTHTKDKPLDVRLFVEDGWLCIENNIVPLLVKKESTKMGLAYIKETMLLMFDRDIAVDNNGRSFIVRIPLLYEHTDY